MSKTLHRAPEPAPTDKGQKKRGVKGMSKQNSRQARTHDKKRSRYRMRQYFKFARGQEVGRKLKRIGKNLRMS